MIAWRALFFSLLLGPMSVRAEVVRIEVTSQADIGSNHFGRFGIYQQLSGRIFFAVDPQTRANRVVVDIDKAPRNAAGKVEFSSNFSLLKPKGSGGNGTLLFEVPNRGARLLSWFFNRATPSSDDWGDGFLFEQGFMLMWLGWQFDVPATPAALRLEAPLARAADGGPISGLVRSDAANEGHRLQLADRDHLPYPVTDSADPVNVLTVRDCIECDREVMPREQWKLTEDRRGILISSGKPRKIYELVYGSKDPPVAGLGFVAVRDALSKLRYDAAPELFGEKRTIRRVVGFGASQSGRFLRDYIYQGFNEDERRRKVFDGVLSHIAGAGRGSFNHRFAQPSRDGHPYLNFFYPVDIFPFTDVEQFDPEIGRRDSLMAHIPIKFLPKVFYINTAYEYWGRSASLTHTRIDGRADAPTMPNVRLYFLTGAKHGPGGGPLLTESQRQMRNPLDYRWVLRKLLLDMNSWLADGTLPPRSAYPRIDEGTLVMPEKLQFPGIPQLHPPLVPKKAYRVDYGPRFLSDGVIDREPPQLGSAFPILVPQVNEDGNEIAGIRLPELEVPLGTYTGWAYAHSNSDPEDTLVTGAGSFVPFPRTRQQRERTGDPRRSVEERYASRQHYLSLVTRSAHKLAQQGYLLHSDVQAVVDQARARWDSLTP